MMLVAASDFSQIRIPRLLRDYAEIFIRMKEWKALEGLEKSDLVADDVIIFGKSEIPPDHVLDFEAALEAKRGMAKDVRYLSLSLDPLLILLSDSRGPQDRCAHLGIQKFLSCSRRVRHPGI